MLRVFHQMDAWLVRQLGHRYLFLRSPLSTKQRVRWVCDQVDGRKLKILEAGCGSGVFSYRLAEEGHEVTAIDLQQYVAKCESRYHAFRDKLPGQIQFIAHDLRTLDKLDGLDGFDCVICTEVIEHIMNDAKLVSDISRCLRKGGRLVLTTPNKHYHPLFGDRVSEIEDGGHVRKGYALADLENICEPSDLEIIQVEYLSGFFTQRLIDLERRVSRTLGGALAAAALYPFRLLSRFDRFVEFEPLCIAIVAEKR